MIKATALPTVNELRAFEAVARLRSVSGAAQELGCSQPCVTHRVKTLERRWSTSLFQRTTRSVEWTAETQLVYDRARSILFELEAMATELTTRSARQRLVITLSPSLASCWLVSRLSSWGARYPDVELKLSATNRYIDLAKEGVDVGIRLLPRDAVVDAPLSSVKLTDERLVVVACPAYLANSQAREPADLLRANLIWQEGTDHWRRFFQAFLVGNPKLPAGPSFNNADLVIRAAMDNQGVAIMREILVADALRNGQLVQVLERTVNCTDAYHFVATREKADKPAVQQFRAWLIDAMSRTLTAAGKGERPW